MTKKINFIYIKLNKYYSKKCLWEKYKKDIENYLNLQNLKITQKIWL